MNDLIIISKYKGLLIERLQGNQIINSNEEYNGVIPECSDDLIEKKERKLTKKELKKASEEEKRLSEKNLIIVTECLLSKDGAVQKALSAETSRVFESEEELQAYIKALKHISDCSNRKEFS